MNFLFLSTLNRPANDREYDQLLKVMQRRYPINEGDGTPALQDVFWALLNCNEFILNH